MIESLTINYALSTINWKKTIYDILNKAKSNIFSTSWKYISPALICIETEKCVDNKESRKGHMADALALGGDEGRDKLR